MKPGEHAMKKKSRKHVLPKVVAAVVERDGKILVARRRKDIRFGGLWEFPGGKLEAGENPEKGLERELAEEFRVQVRVEGLLISIPFHSPTLSIELLAYKAVHVSGEFCPVDHDEIRWVEPAGLDESAFTEPDRPVVRFLKSAAAGEGEECG